MKQIVAVLLIAFLCTTCKQEKKSTETLALIETSMGNLKIKLYNSTPKHKANFIKLVKEGYYDGLLFHRVIQNFMMQGGDPKSKDAISGLMLGSGGPGYTIPAEIGKHHFKGALAAARTGGDSNPNKESSGSQFYIVQGQTIDRSQLGMMTSGKNINYTDADKKKYETIGGAPFLDGDYTVFGEVVEGMQVIDKICSVQCDSNNRPVQDIKMKIRML
jgi:cyclophilin family peptidyl-prolyl cis-trans isomerase